MLSTISKHILLSSAAVFAFCSVLSAQPTVIEQNNINKDEILAEVGDIKISVEEFVNGYEFGYAFYKRNKDSKKKYVRYLINEKLLAIKAYEEKIDTSEQVKEILNDIKNDLATEELFKEEILKNLEVADSEIDSVVNLKQIELDIKWLYSENRDGINKLLLKLKNHVPFDTLYNQQFNDNIAPDLRSLVTTRYQLGQKNIPLANIIDTLKVGNYSAPIHTDDGWYIVKLNNVFKSVLANETEVNKLRYESKQALVKNKMDIASDEYVGNLMSAANPIIKRESFNIVRSFVGKYMLPKDKHEAWHLDAKADSLLKIKNIADPSKIGMIPLVVYSGGEINIDKFLRWFRNRIQYIKLNESGLPAFSYSLEQLIWRMIRDELLIKTAESRGMYSKPEVVKQSELWKDKIVFSAYMNRLKNDVELKSNEVNVNQRNAGPSDIDRMNNEITQKIFRELVVLKQKYKVKINEEILSNILVSSENDPDAIELYTVKKGGLIPRTPYPSIDNFWQFWE